MFQVTRMEPHQDGCYSCGQHAGWTVVDLEGLAADFCRPHMAIRVTANAWNVGMVFSHTFARSNGPTLDDLKDVARQLGVEVRD